MRPVPYTTHKLWPMVKECWLACMTCLSDEDFWRTWARSSSGFFSGFLVFLAKLLVTLLWPIAGLILAPILLWNNRSIEKWEEKAKQQITEAIAGNRQKL